MESPRSRKQYVLLAVLLILLVLSVISIVSQRRQIGRAVDYVENRLQRRASVAERVQQYGPAVHERLLPLFKSAGVAYPPGRVVLVGLKQDKELQVYAASTEHDELRLIRKYPILAASGHAGPKLRQGDQQVPEGIYGIDYLNPNSAFHLSLAVSYPNRFDKARAREEDRRELGGDIMIHGSDQSIGCLAMGDEAAEDLFVLAAETGPKNVKIILAPTDLRYSDMKPAEDQPAWVADLYDDIRHELNQLPE